MSNTEIDRPTGVKPGRPTSSWVMLAILAAIVCVYAGLLIKKRLSPDHEQYGGHPAVGTRLPYLKLQPLTGDSTAVTLDDIRGQTVLLNFWGTWCGPCKEEFPHLATLAEKLKSESDFRLLAVSCGGDDSSDEEFSDLQAATEKFLREQHSRLPTYADRGATTRSSVAMALHDDQFGYYPTTILLDGEARIRGVWVGYDEGATDEMERSIDALLHPAAK